jgi:hypothetical protein
MAVQTLLITDDLFRLVSGLFCRLIAKPCYTILVAFVIAGVMYVILEGCNNKNLLMDRNADVVTRQKYVTLVNSVKGSGGNVHIFSSMHVSGEREYMHFSYEWCFRYLTLVLNVSLKQLSNYLFK